MPRRKKPGTRKSTILQRHRRQAKSARLIGALRRVGVSTALVVFVLWLGAWIALSGVIDRAQSAISAGFVRHAAAHGFVVQDVLVEGRKYTDPELILGILNIDRGDPIFDFDPARAHENLSKITWISDLSVERRLPGIVYVSIREREPFALWQNNGKLHLIDREGFVISDTQTELARFHDLPFVVGDGARDHASALIDLISAEPLVRERLEAAIYVGKRRWDLRLKNGTAINLPEEDLSLALRRLGDAQERDLLLDKNVQSIDLRETSRIIIQTRPGAVQEYKASLRGGSPI